ncbi:MAG: hypothetical protein V1918_10635 [Planctomycetota bacterium]
MRPKRGEPAAARRSLGRTIRRGGWVYLLAVVSGMGGCAGPVVTYVADTAVEKDGRTSRSVTIASQARKAPGAGAFDLEKYLVLPPPERFQRYEKTAERVSFAGQYATPESIPVDFVKKTRGTDLLAHNRIVVRRRDYILFSAMEFEERVDDIVERAEVDEAVEQAAQLSVAALTGALESEFGADYDLARFDEYLQATVPEIAVRLYQVLWEIRRSARDGAGVESDDAEWDRRYKKEMSRWGLSLSSEGTKLARKQNEARCWSFLDDHLRDLVTPRRAEAPALSAKDFQDPERQMRLLLQTIGQVRASFGSFDRFLQQVGLPLILGAFSGLDIPVAFTDDEIQFLPSEPSFQFLFRLRLPGRVVETNALQDLDGSLLWRFDGSDLMLTGCRMWARTLVVDEAALRRLGLVDFPGSLAAVERFHEAMATAGGRVDPALAMLLRRCVSEGSLKALRDAALPATPPVGPELDADSPQRNRVSPEAAGRLLGVVSAFYRPEERSATPASAAAPLAGPPVEAAPSAARAEAAALLPATAEAEAVLPDKTPESATPPLLFQAP